MTINSLDDLFADAAQRITREAQDKKRIVRNATPELLKPIRVSERYLLPENWIEGKCIALVHGDTGTVLGNFRIFHHKYEKTARRLERVSEPTETSGIERVWGKHWITESRPIPSPERWESSRELFISELVLQDFGVSSIEDMVRIKVCLAHGGILRVELLDHTQFASPDNRTLLTLPAGTNVLEVMSLESKINLRKEMQV